MHSAWMALPNSKAADRLRTAREAAGYESATRAAQALGVPEPTYLAHENGSRGYTRVASRYADRFKVTVDWLTRGKGRGPQLVPVVGYVGAGAEMLPFDDSPVGGGLERVEAPVGEEGCVAVVIRGESMHPLKEGWLIFYRRDAEGVESDCIGELCVVKISDGATMLKTVQRDPAPGLWRLESWNAPTREGVRLEWASRVLEIRPKWRTLLQR